jgi:universal stress protein E
MGMEAFRRIVAAVDLGPRAERVTPGSRSAIERAAWLAGRVQGSLRLVHSVRPDEYWDGAQNRFIAGRGGSQRQETLDALVADLTARGLETSLAVRPEPAWLAIVQEVLRERIDLVVASKRTDIHTDDRKLGTVARKLIRKCPCAVWLEDPRDTSDPAVILAATDLTPVGDRAVRLAASVADALGSELHVVHAYGITLEAQFEGGQARRAYEQRQHAEAVTEIQAVLAGGPFAGKAVLHVGLTSPTQAVLEGIERLHPGLVVMGTISRGGIPGLLMGNTAERLIDRIDCALLTVKPDDFVCPVAPESE